MKQKLVKLLIPLLLTAVITLAQAALIQAFAASPAEEAQINAETAEIYERRTTYAADFSGGTPASGDNWALLHEVYVNEGSIYGFPTAACGEYGIGFCKKTPGRGTTEFSARITIPEGKGGVMISLRLTDYTDSRREPKGLRIMLWADGTLGLYNPRGRKTAAQKTGYSFTEGRKLYVEDNADADVITLYIDNDAGEKVLLAECTFGEQQVEMTYVQEDLTPAVLEYDYKIYKDGYMTLTSGASKVYFKDVSVTLPEFSATPFEVSAQTVIGNPANAAGKQNDTEKPDGNGQAGSMNGTRTDAFKTGATTKITVFSCLAGAMLVIAVFTAAALIKQIKANKKTQRKEDGSE